MLTGGPWTVTIDETQALNEEILRLTATDSDVSAPHYQFVFETTSNHQWFGVYEDGRVYVKRVGLKIVILWCLIHENQFWNEMCVPSFSYIYVEVL